MNGLVVGTLRLRLDWAVADVEAQVESPQYVRMNLQAELLTNKLCALLACQVAPILQPLVIVDVLQNTYGIRLQLTSAVRVASLDLAALKVPDDDIAHSALIDVEKPSHSAVLGPEAL